MAVQRRTSADTVRAAGERLGLAGLLPDDKPGTGRPAVPADVSRLTDEELMGLFSALTQWLSYVGGKAAQYAVEEKAAQQALDIEEARFLVNNWGSQDKVTVARAQRDADPKVIEMKEHLLGVYTTRKIAESTLRGLEASVSLVSRELTRRTGNASVGRAQRWS